MKRSDRASQPFAADRHVKLARQLHGRILLRRSAAGGGRSAAMTVELVRGEPGFADLHACLVRWSRVRCAPPGPTARDMGFGARHVTLVSRAGLNNRARALQQWRHALDARAKRRHAASLHDRIRESWAEVESLSIRVDQLHAILRGDVPTEVADVHYALPPAEEADLQRLLTACGAEVFLEPGIPELVRLVAWLASPTHARRVLEAMRPSLGTASEFRAREHLLRIDAAIAHALHMNPQAGEARHEFDLGSRSSAIAETIKHLPDDVRDRLLRCRINDVHRFQRAVKQELDRLPPGISLAFWASFVAASVVLPIESCVCGISSERKLRPSDEQGGLAIDCFRPQEIGDYVHRACHGLGTPGAELTVQLLNHLPAWPFPGTVRSLAPLMKDPSDVEDVACCLERMCTEGVRVDDACHVVGKASVSPGLLRRFIEATTRLAPAWPTKDVVELTHRIAVAKRDGVVRAMVMQMNSIPPRVARARVGRDFIQVLKACLASCRHNSRISDALFAWATRSVGRSPPDAPALPPSWAPAVRRWARRLFHDQRSLGLPASLPASIRTRLDDRQRARELAYLQPLVDAGRASPAQVLRCRHLAQGMSRPITEARLERVIVEAASRTSLKLLRRRTVRWFATQWRDLFGTRPASVSPTEGMQLLTFRESLADDARNAFDRIATAWKTHGETYRAMLPANAAWLQEAGKRGVDLSPWLGPSPKTLRCGPHRLTIGIAVDPAQVFLMGTYFDTCLSIHDDPGCNALSTLPNAADANKAVVLLRDSRGRVVGRKLLALNRQFELLGYATYLRLPNDVAREPVEAAVERYCGRLALRMNVPLACTGRPEELHGWKWYDDGVRPWSRVASAAAETDTGCVPDRDATSARLDQAAADEIALAAAIDSADVAVLGEFGRDLTAAVNFPALYWLFRHDPAAPVFSLHRDDVRGSWRLRGVARILASGEYLDADGWFRLARERDWQTTTFALRELGTGLPFARGTARTILRILQRLPAGLVTDSSWLCRSCVLPLASWTVDGPAVLAKLLHEVDRIARAKYDRCLNRDAALAAWCQAFVACWIRERDPEPVLAAAQGSDDLEQLVAMFLATRHRIPGIARILRRRMKANHPEYRQELTEALARQGERQDDARIARSRAERDATVPSRADAGSSLDHTVVGLVRAAHDDFSRLQPAVDALAACPPEQRSDVGDLWAIALVSGTDETRSLARDQILTSASTSTYRLKDALDWMTSLLGADASRPAERFRKEMVALAMFLQRARDPTFASLAFWLQTFPESDRESVLVEVCSGEIECPVAATEAPWPTIGPVGDGFCDDSCCTYELIAHLLARDVDRQAALEAYLAVWMRHEPDTVFTMLHDVIPWLPTATADRILGRLFSVVARGDSTADSVRRKDRAETVLNALSGGGSERPGSWRLQSAIIRNLLPQLDAPERQRIAASLRESSRSSVRGDLFVPLLDEVLGQGDGVP